MSLYPFAWGRSRMATVTDKPIPMTFVQTNCVIERTDTSDQPYAACKAGNCTWVGPTRKTPAAAKRDAIRHHLADSGRWAEGGGDW